MDDESPHGPQEWWLFLLEHDHGRSLSVYLGPVKKTPKSSGTWSWTQRQALHVNMHYGLGEDL